MITHTCVIICHCHSVAIWVWAPSPTVDITFSNLHDGFSLLWKRMLPLQLVMLVHLWKCMLPFLPTHDACMCACGNVKLVNSPLSVHHSRSNTRGTSLPISSNMFMLWWAALVSTKGLHYTQVIKHPIDWIWHQKYRPVKRISIEGCDDAGLHFYDVIKKSSKEMILHTRIVRLLYVQTRLLWSKDVL